MIIIENTLISDEILQEKFVCDLAACKWACCVAGESGAPLEEDEARKLEKIFPLLKPYLLPEGIREIERQGTSVVDVDGDLTTPLIGHEGPCAYAVYEADGTAKCGIENANRAGAVDFVKPISCHLYPIRVSKLNSGLALNYHRWPICAPACECGSRLNVRVFRFLREPLIRRFGSEWFEALEAAFNEQDAEH
jgi:hypothetical protein